MAKSMELNGLIHSQFKNEASLARALGWPRQRLNKITSGSKEPNISEAVQIARQLGVSVDRLSDIFFESKSPNGQL